MSSNKINTHNKKKINKTNHKNDKLYKKSSIPHNLAAMFTTNKFTLSLQFTDQYKIQKEETSVRYALNYL